MKKVISILAIIIMLSTFVMQLSINTVLAAEEGNVEYLLYSVYSSEYTGPTFEIGKKLDGNFLVALKKVENGESSLIELDNEKLKITSSDETIMSVSKDGNNKLECVGEGWVEITYEYNYEGKDYTTKAKYLIYNKDDKFKINDSEDIFVCLEKSKYSLKAGEKADVVVNIKSVRYSYVTTSEDSSNTAQNNIESSNDVTNSDYKYEWSSSNENIVKIENGKNENKASIVAVSGGEAEIYCTVKTADESLSVKKTININVKAEESNAEYSLYSIYSSEYTGPTFEIGKKLDGNVLVVLNKVENGESSVIELDNEKLKITSSDETIMSVSKDGNNKLECVGEGWVEITYEYNYEGKDYTTKAKYLIYNKDDKFKINDSEDIFVCLEKSKYSLKAGEKADVIVNLKSVIYYYVTTSEDSSNTAQNNIESSNDVTNSDYKYEWSSSNENIVKIESEKNGNKASIVAVSGGEAEIYCTVKKEGESSSVKKIIKVSVTKDKKEDKEEEKENDRTKSPNPLAEAGDKSIMVLATIIVGMIVSIIIMKKFKKLN